MVTAALVAPAVLQVQVVLADLAVCCWATRVPRVPGVPVVMAVWVASEAPVARASITAPCKA